FIFPSASTDASADTRAIAGTGLGLAKVKRSDWYLTGSATGCLTQNLQWGQAETRKTGATKTALMPPIMATELPPAKPFRSAWCRFTMISIPRIEKPIASLIRLIRVAILCSNWRLSTQSVASTFESDARANLRLKLEVAS